MLDRKTINFWTDKAKRVEAAHLLDLCESAFEKREVTPFLSSGMRLWLSNVLKSTSVCYQCWGGFPDAERERVVLDANSKELFQEHAQVTLIQALPHKKNVHLGHRDILGSLLGLGLERGVLGDIRQSEKGPVIAVADPIQDFILNQWTSVGREKVDTSLYHDSAGILPLAGYEKRIVTASSRLDSFAAAGFGVSRSVMQDYIRQGLVKRNDIVMSKPDLELGEGDIVSCRGKGRLKILGEDQKTRKGRQVWKIFLFSDK